MEYIALYRKYRPKSFSEIIGQKNIITILQNQITTEKITHAYLFSGTRGTGKTSAAKIFAKAVNCENHQNGEPCHICNTCKNIGNSNIMDIIEIDAASNRGVDEIRELREKVKYPPTIGSYKVYIIDEVHMLTTEAFNALLKTLEEPPKHVIFILATTEPNKLPTTILSRCQRFNFKRIDQQDILNRMAYICKEIQIQIEEKTLKLIAKNSDGAMRDALSILEQCLSISSDNKVDYSSVKELLGISDDHLVYLLIEAIVNKNVNAALGYLDEAYKSGKEMNVLMNQLILVLRDMLILKITNTSENLIEANEDNASTLKELGTQIETELIAHNIEYLTDMENKMKYSSLPKVLMEVVLMKLCTNALVPKNHVPTNTQVKTPIQSPVKEVQKQVERPIEGKASNSVGEEKSVYGKSSDFDFGLLCNGIKKESMALGSSLQMGKFTSTIDNMVNIAFDENDAFHLQRVNKSKAAIESMAQKIFQTPYVIHFEIQKKDEDSFVKLTREVFGDDKVVVIDD